MEGRECLEQLPGSVVNLTFIVYSVYSGSMRFSNEDAKELQEVHQYSDLRSHSTRWHVASNGLCQEPQGVVHSD